MKSWGFLVVKIQVGFGDRAICGVHSVLAGSYRTFVFLILHDRDRPPVGERVRRCDAAKADALFRHRLAEAPVLPREPQLRQGGEENQLQHTEA